ncbi:MAG: recombinase [archaeon]|nr:recombinase [archaeon]
MQKGRGEETITKHYSNIEYYLNEYVLNVGDSISAGEGIYLVETFFEYDVIGNSWTTEYSIKSKVSSIKVFYKFMHEKGFINNEPLNELKTLIKEEMPNWLDSIKK